MWANMPKLACMLSHSPRSLTNIATSPSRQIDHPPSVRGNRDASRINRIQTNVLPAAEQVHPLPHLLLVYSRYPVALLSVGSQSQVHGIDILGDLFLDRVG